MRLHCWVCHAPTLIAPFMPTVPSGVALPAHLLHLGLCTACQTYLCLNENWKSSFTRPQSFYLCVSHSSCSVFLKSHSTPSPIVTFPFCLPSSGQACILSAFELTSILSGTFLVSKLFRQGKQSGLHWLSLVHHPVVTNIITLKLVGKPLSKALKPQTPAGVKHENICFSWGAVGNLAGYLPSSKWVDGIQQNAMLLCNLLSAIPCAKQSRLHEILQFGFWGSPSGCSKALERDLCRGNCLKLSS